MRNNSLFFLVSAIGLFSTPLLSNAACLTSDQILIQKQNIENMIDSLSVSASHQPESVLLRETCYKKIFQRRAFIFGIYRDPNEINLQKISGYVTDASEFEGVDLQSCLSRARSILHSFSERWIDNALERYAALYPWQTDDLDIGPVVFLDCKNLNSSQFFHSIDTLMHESTHTLTEPYHSESCLYQTLSGQKICFDLDPKLPHRNLAKYSRDELPKELLPFIEAYDTIQDLYFVKLDEPLYFLFDELNAYTVENAIEAALLKRDSKALFGPSENRPIENLPLFMFYTVNYLVNLQTESPDLFERMFSAGSKNMKSALRLLEAAESSYVTWRSLLKRSGKLETPAEKYFFERYSRLAHLLQTGERMPRRHQSASTARGPKSHSST